MRLLLTSAGVKNDSIHAALVGMLDKPIAECTALCIPTASYGHPWVSPERTWNFVSGNEPENPMVGLGWKSVGALELTALPSLRREQWLPSVQEADVLLASGGDAAYLCYWMRRSGLADLLPSLNALWMGMSAGSMVMTPRIGEDFVSWTPPAGIPDPPVDDATLGLVDFSIFPHMDSPGLPHNTAAHAERWAATMPLPVYAIDDQTAIRVADGAVEVVSEGIWRHFAP